MQRFGDNLAFEGNSDGVRTMRQHNFIDFLGHFLPYKNIYFSDSEGDGFFGLGDLGDSIVCLDCDFIFEVLGRIFLALVLIH